MGGADDDGMKPRAFKGHEPPNYLLGFGASALSSIPELFGAQPWDTAEAFRTANPISGIASEMLGFAVPYLGAEAAVAKSPALAARLAGATESLVGRAGMTAAESPIASGAARELIINAPIEATRLATGALLFPDNFEEQFGNVATDVALTGALGAGFGALKKVGGKKVADEYIKGTSLYDSPTFKLRALDEGAETLNVPDKELFAEQLERQVFTGNPGYTGVKGAAKPNDYVSQLEGHTPDQSKGLNSLFVPKKQKVFEEGSEALLEDPHNPLTGLTKQYLWENQTANGPTKNLNPGELDATILPLMPPGLQTTRDIAKNVDSPRLLTVEDENGARELAGILNLPGLTKVGPNTALVQEKDGLFVVVHKLVQGEPAKFKGRKSKKKLAEHEELGSWGDGAGKVNPHDKYVIGKTDNPGLFAPEAQGMSDLVTASWAKRAIPFQPGRNPNIFNKLYDDLIEALPDEDFRAAQQIKNDKKRKSFIAERLGDAKAKTTGLLDQKFNYKDSGSIQDLAQSISILIKPQSFLERDNPMFHKMNVLLRAAVDHADAMQKSIVSGKQIIKGTPAEALRGVNVDRVSGYKDVLPIDQMRRGATDEDANLITHLAWGDAASQAELKRLVKSGDLTEDGRLMAEDMRDANQKLLSDIIPVLDEAGHADTVWLENHLGIPKIYQGDYFVPVTDTATGELKHTAFGKTKPQAELNAKLAVDEAKAEGQAWEFDAAKMRELPNSTDEELAKMQEKISTNLAKNPADVRILSRSMQRLAIMKATTGKGPGIPITSKALAKRSPVPTTADLKGASSKGAMDQLMNAYSGHVGTLTKFAAVQSFQSRFGHMFPEMFKNDPKMLEVLMEKERSHLGIASQFTNALDKSLSKVLGGVGGARPATKISAAVNKTMFQFTLGMANPTQAVLSLLSPLQTVAPWIMHMATVPIESASHLMQFTPVMGFDGRPRGMSAWLEPIKVLGDAIKLTSKPTPELMGHIQQALREGIFHSKNIEEWIGGTSRNRTTLNEAWKSGGMPSFLMKLSTVMGESAESLSRLVAWNAAYRVGKEFFGLEGDDLYRFMKKGNETTMFNYHTTDRSKLFTGPIGSMFGLFKNWQMHFMGNMMQYAGLAINEGNFGPLVWAGGSAVALGGLGATPLVAMADGLGNWENDANSSYLWMEKNFSPTLADPLYFGLPAFLGVSLQASSTLPGTDVRNETSSLFSFAIAQRATMLGKAIGKGWEYAEATGNNPLNDSNVRDMLTQATAPRFMIRAISLTEGDYVKSMSTGYPMIQGENIGYTGKMLQGLGMNELEIAKAQEASQVLYKSEEARKSAIAGLGRGYYNAISDGDKDEAGRIIQRTIAMHVPLDSVMKSAMMVRQREEGSDILSRYSNLGQYEARQATQMEYPR